MTADMQPSGIFKSAHEAAAFAYRFSSQQYGKSAMAIAMANHPPTVRGLGGLDGAAQAGMIQRMVRELGELHEAIVMARYLPKTTPCSCDAPCCSGARPNLDWNAAVRRVGYLAIAATPGCVSNMALRCGVVMKHYGERIDIGRLADQAGVHRNTASKHTALILGWLRGRAGKKGDAAQIGQEALAMQRLTEAIEGAGLLLAD